MNARPVDRPDTVAVAIGTEAASFFRAPRPADRFNVRLIGSGARRETRVARGANFAASDAVARGTAWQQTAADAVHGIETKRKFASRNVPVHQFSRHRDTGRGSRLDQIGAAAEVHAL